MTYVRASPPTVSNERTASLTLTIQAALKDLHSNEALKLKSDHMAFNESMP